MKKSQFQQNFTSTFFTFYSSEDTAIKAFFIRTGKFGECKKIIAGHTGPITDLRAIALNTVLLSSSQKDATIRMWDLQNYTCFRVISLGNDIKMDLSNYLDHDFRGFFVRNTDKSSADNFNFISCSVKVLATVAKECEP